MDIVQVISDKLNEIVEYFMKKLFEKEEAEENNTNTEEMEEELSFDLQEDDDRFVVEQRSLINKLYSLSKMIKCFEDIYPEKYNEFSIKIETLMKDYQRTLEEYLNSYPNGDVTFEIDPDKDTKRVYEVINLEKEISYFIDNDFRFSIISKKVQKLCLKLNILYNTSFIYYKESDMQKVEAQTERARDTLKELVEDLKSYNFFVSDKMKREYLIDFISYADYLIFKCNLKNSNTSLAELLNSLVLIKEFVGIDIEIVFRDLVIDELENLEELVEKLQFTNFYEIFLNRILYLQSETTIFKIANDMFWRSFLEIESDVLNCLHLNNQSGDIALLSRFHIDIDENEVFFSVKSQACLTLADIYYKTQDIEVFIVLKLVSLLDDELTYKEVYFILLLFDLVDKITTRKEISKSFVVNIEKQEQNPRYEYSKEQIEQKKKYVLKRSGKLGDYVKILSSDDSTISKVSHTLEEKNFDFVATGNSIYLNTIYFKELKNVIRCLNDIITY